MTQRWIILGAAITLLTMAALLVAACSPQQRAALQALADATRADTPKSTAIVQAPSPVTGTATATPQFSRLVTPTLQPTMAGPLGTLTAIAELVASPTQNAEPYVIENRGNPHFIEFHAWW